jgi:two-component system, LuxR family, response regulator FixJ
MSSSHVVHIVASDTAYRFAVSDTLTPLGFDTSSYPSPDSFLDIASTLSSGCVLLRIDRPEDLRVLTALVRQGNGLPVIVIGPQAVVETAVEPLKLGAAGFLETTVGKDALAAAVNVALAEYSLSLRQSELRAAKGRINSLSPREKEVLDGISAGFSTKAIARTLKLSPRTVEVHRQRLMKRLCVRGSAAAVRLAALAEFAFGWSMPNDPVIRNGHIIPGKILRM